MGDFAAIWRRLGRCERLGGLGVSGSTTRRHRRLARAATGDATHAQPMTSSAARPQAAWTAADCPSQHGRTFIVTGANSGLGLETAGALTRARCAGRARCA